MLMHGAVERRCLFCGNTIRPRARVCVDDASFLGCGTDPVDAGKAAWGGRRGAREDANAAGGSHAGGDLHHSTRPGPREPRPRCHREIALRGTGERGRSDRLWAEEWRVCAEKLPYIYRHGSSALLSGWCALAMLLFFVCRRYLL